MMPINGMGGPLVAKLREWDKKAGIGALGTKTGGTEGMITTLRVSAPWALPFSTQGKATLPGPSWVMPCKERGIFTIAIILT
jgi:hypothetical protein